MRWAFWRKRPAGDALGDDRVPAGPYMRSIESYAYEGVIVRCGERRAANDPIVTAAPGLWIDADLDDHAWRNARREWLTR